MPFSYISESDTTTINVGNNRFSALESNGEFERVEEEDEVIEVMEWKGAHDYYNHINAAYPPTLPHQPLTPPTTSSIICEFESIDDDHDTTRFEMVLDSAATTTTTTPDSHSPKSRKVAKRSGLSRGQKKNRNRRLRRLNRPSPDIIADMTEHFELTDGLGNIGHGYGLWEFQARWQRGNQCA